MLPTNLSRFYCRVFQKDISFLTHDHHEVLQRFQGARHFALDQHLRLETPGWRVHDFYGNHLSDDEMEQQKAKRKKGPILVPDCEHPFAEDLSADMAVFVDPKLPVLVKVSCLMEVLKMGHSYQLVKKLWAQFLLTAGRVNAEVAWTRNVVKVSFVSFPESLRLIPDPYCCFAFGRSS